MIDKKVIDMEVAHFQKKAQSIILRLIEEGEFLVKSELKSEWPKYVIDGARDVFCTYTIEISLKIMKVLTEGKSPKEAKETVEEKLVLKITPHQMRYITPAIFKFHSRGKEFREYYIKQYIKKDLSKGQKPRRQE